MPDDGKSLTTEEGGDAPWNPYSAAKRPAYEGFHVERDYSTDGFKLGLITVPELEESEEFGDAFLIAPDNSRCGLIYEVGLEPECAVCIEPEPRRWGVYNVTVTHTMTTEEGRKQNLIELVQMLRSAWEKWRADKI